MEGIPPARRAGAHGRVRALETALAPGVGEVEGLEFLFVFLFRGHAVFGPRHGFVGPVDVAGVSVAVCGGGGGVCGCRGGVGRRVGAGFGFEEGAGALAEGHLEGWVFLLEVFEFGLLGCCVDSGGDCYRRGWRRPREGIEGASLCDRRGTTARDGLRTGVRRVVEEKVG